MFDSHPSPAKELDAYQSSLATDDGQPGVVDVRLIPPGRYRIDPDHTHVAWTVNHMGFSLLEGLLGAAGGSITFDPKRIAASRVEVEFNVSELRVTTEAFAQHLKSEELFDFIHFPTVRFVSTNVTPTGQGRADVVGELTIKGITREVTLKAALVGAGENPMSHQLNFGFTALATLKRSDFGLGFIAPVVSDTVKLRINAAFATGQ